MLDAPKLAIRSFAFTGDPLDLFPTTLGCLVQLVRDEQTCTVCILFVYAIGVVWVSAQELIFQKGAVGGSKGGGTPTCKGSKRIEY